MAAPEAFRLVARTWEVNLVTDFPRHGPGPSGTRSARVGIAIDARFPARSPPQRVTRSSGALPWRGRPRRRTGRSSDIAEIAADYARLRRTPPEGRWSRKSRSNPDSPGKPPAVPGVLLGIHQRGGALQPFPRFGQPALAVEHPCTRRVRVRQEPVPADPRRLTGPKSAGSASASWTSRAVQCAQRMRSRSVAMYWKAMVPPA